MYFKRKVLTNSNLNYFFFPKNKNISATSDEVCAAYKTPKKAGEDDVSPAELRDLVIFCLDEFVCIDSSSQNYSFSSVRQCS